MVERFVLTDGAISIANGSSTVTGVGTAFNGRDLAGAQLRACPLDAPSFRVGTIAEVLPRGAYNNLSLPLVTPYRGATLVAVPFELVYGPAIASGATQAAVFERFLSFLEQNAGLIFNSADDINLGLIPNNSIYIDDVTRTIYQWRDGVLNVVRVIGDQWTPKGVHSMVATYAINNMVQAGNFIFVSNINANTGNAPNTAPASTAQWTWVPLPTVQQVLNELGIHKITVSTAFPAGGVDGDLWFKVS